MVSSVIKICNIFFHKFWMGFCLRLTLNCNLQYNFHFFYFRPPLTIPLKICREPGIRPFPSCVLPRPQNESSCKTFLMKMNLFYMKMNARVKHIFIKMVSHEDSFWRWCKRHLGNGLFTWVLVHFHATQTHFHMKSFAQGLILKQRLKAYR